MSTKQFIIDFIKTLIPFPLEQQTESIDKSFVKPNNWKLFNRIEYTQKKLEANHPRNQSLNQKSGKAPVNLPAIHLSHDQVNDTFLHSTLEQYRESGGTIFLPPGKFELTKPLHLSSHIEIIGVADKTTLVFKNIDYPIMIRGEENTPVTQVKLKDLMIYDQGEHKFCSAIFVALCSELVISHVDIINPRGVGILMADNTVFSHLYKCSVTHAGLAGFMLVRDVENTIFEQCSAQYCEQSGIFLTDLKLPENTDLMDFDTQIDYTHRIIGNFGPFDFQDPSPLRTELLNCNFSHNRKMGITTDGVGYLSVKNTLIAHNDCEGITIDNGSWGCQVLQCHIFNNGWRGRQHEIELGIDFVEEMGLMDDGSSKAKLPGVSLDNAAYTRIEHNHIDSNWGDGVKLVRAAYANTISNNLIENNNRGTNDRFHYFGILIGQAERQHPDQDDFHSCSNRVFENDILGAHYAGIHLMGEVEGNHIKDNLIDGAYYEAIENHSDLNNYIESYFTN